jgi:hypothetical protein
MAPLWLLAQTVTTEQSGNQFQLRRNDLKANNVWRMTSIPRHAVSDEV